MPTATSSSRTAPKTLSSPAAKIFPPSRWKMRSTSTPAVAAAAVVAKPDDKWGETPCAFIELKPGQKTTQEDLIAWCRKNLASYKCPRFVVFTELPRTSTGKIQKFKLREMAKAV